MDSTGFYETLKLDGTEVENWVISLQALVGSDTLNFRMTVPLDATPGVHEATLVFWAEAVEYVIPPL